MSKYILILFMILFLGAVSSSCLMMTKRPTIYFIPSINMSVENPKIIKVWIDITFKINQRESIIEAISQWNKVLNGFKIIKVEGSFDMEVDIVKRADSGEGWIILNVESSIMQRSSTMKTLAFVNDFKGSRMYIFSDLVNDDWFTGVTLHEIGHLLGGRHGNGTLLEAHFDLEQSKCIDKETATNVARLNGIPENLVGYCQ